VVNDDIPRLALTAGEPAGIGPDICIALTSQSLPAELVIIADPKLLRDRAALLGTPIGIELFDANRTPCEHSRGTLTVLPVNLIAPVKPGVTDPANAPYVIETLSRALEETRSGTFDALITCPVHKGVINKAGIPFTGHTEWLASQTQSTRPVMMLATDTMRVALATTHMPLRNVPDAITPSLLHETITILNEGLRTRIGIQTPRILVCGLNPHAGEAGFLGEEETKTIAPAIDQLRRDGIQVIGPVPADTAFLPHQLKHCDVILAMYHDQGLTVLKHAGFDNAVNITFGLPIIRTSVDHGTALELAGTGQARNTSLIAAIDQAIRMIQSNTAHNNQPA